MSEWQSTDVGEIPAEWHLVRLSDLASQIVDGTHFTPTYRDSGIPFLRVTDIQTTQIELEQVKRISEKEHRILNQRCNPSCGDILLSKNGTVGIPMLVNWDWPFSIFVSLCLIKLKPTALSTFMRVVLESPIIAQQIHRRSKQGTVTNLHLEEIRDFQIPLPPLPQQRKIARILTTLDNVIEKTEALIAKYQAIKQGLMHDLFTRGVDATGKLRPPQSEAPELYKQSELGWIPKEWEVERLTNIASYQTGPPFPSAEYSDEGIHLLRPGNLTADEYVRWDTAHTTFLPSEWESKAAAFVVGEGEVVMNLTAQSLEDQFLGRVCITPTGTHCLLNQRLARFRATKCHLPFLFWAFKGPHFRYHIDRLTQGTKVQHIYNANLNSALVAVPNSESEPRLIAGIMFSVTRAVQNERHQRQVLRDLKTGLMQDLLTGKVPVKADEPEEEGKGGMKNGE